MKGACSVSLHGPAIIKLGISLLALDIEGIDAEVLLDINLSNLKLKYISFEHLHLGNYKEDVLNHFKNNNYEFLGLGFLELLEDIQKDGDMVYSQKTMTAYRVFMAEGVKLFAEA